MSVSRVGLVVHPSRDVSGPVGELRAWCEERGADLVRLPHDAACDARGLDLVVAVGGDGTVLGGVRAAAPAQVPVLGIACGSLGALTAVAGSATRTALDRFAAGDWVARPLGALDVRDDAGTTVAALNDVAIVRKGGGQVKVSIAVDGELYVRVAGDGVVVSTPLGTSAYGMAAGGPIALPGSAVTVVTPLAPHGGCAPPLVVPAERALRLEAEGYGGMRIEVDGQPTDLQPGGLDVALRAEHVVLVGFGDGEPYLAGLRRRGIVADAPRIVAHDARMAQT